MLIVIILVVILLAYLLFEEYRSYSGDTRNLATRIPLPNDPKIRLTNRLSNLIRYVMWRHAMILALTVILIILVYTYYNGDVISSYTLLGIWFVIFGTKYLLDTLIRYSRIGVGVDIDYDLIRRA